MNLKSLRNFSFKAMVCLGMFLFSTYLYTNYAQKRNMDPPPNSGIYAPEVNPNPTYFLTVKGFIDPKLENKVPLRVITTFMASNPACDYVDNPLVGPRYRTAMIEGRIPPDAKGHYVYKLPLDYYKPGFCKWRILIVQYTDTNKTLNELSYDAKGNIASFIRPKNFTLMNEIGVDNLICSTQASCISSSYVYYAVGDLAPNQNYNFTLNMRKQS